MNEWLQVFTAFGVMIAGDKPALGPINCEKQVEKTIDPMLLKDEHGRLGENIALDRREDGPETYFFTYKIRKTDGTEHAHIYHVSASKDCKNISVKRL